MPQTLHHRKIPWYFHNPRNYGVLKSSVRSYVQNDSVSETKMRTTKWDFASWQTSSHKNVWGQGNCELSIRRWRGIVSNNRSIHKIYYHLNTIFKTQLNMFHTHLIMRTIIFCNFGSRQWTSFGSNGDHFGNHNMYCQKRCDAHLKGITQENISWSVNPCDSKTSNVELKEDSRVHKWGTAFPILKRHGTFAFWSWEIFWIIRICGKYFGWFKYWGYIEVTLELFFKIRIFGVYLGEFGHLGYNVSIVLIIRDLRMLRKDNNSNSRFPYSKNVLKKTAELHISWPNPFSTGISTRNDRKCFLTIDCLFFIRQRVDFGRCRIFDQRFGKQTVDGKYPSESMRMNIGNNKPPTRTIMETCWLVISNFPSFFSVVYTMTWEIAFHFQYVRARKHNSYLSLFTYSTTAIGTMNWELLHHVAHFVFSVIL